MTPEQTCFLVFAMVVLVVMNNILPRYRDGHACPLCGTQREDKHSDECPRKER